jgi:uncharacterized protein
VTAPQLLTWICAGLLLQLVLGVGVAMVRRRSTTPSVRVADVHDARVSPTGAWPGWRAFRVQTREFEDAAKTQCSFYLEPVDGAPLPTFKPGQFLTFSLQVPDADADSAGQARAVTRCQ